MQCGIIWPEMGLFLVSCESELSENSPSLKEQVKTIWCCLLWSWASKRMVLAGGILKWVVASSSPRWMVMSNPQYHLRVGKEKGQSANSDHWRPDRKPMTRMSHLSVSKGLGKPTIHLKPRPIFVTCGFPLGFPSDADASNQAIGRVCRSANLPGHAPVQGQLMEHARASRRPPLRGKKIKANRNLGSNGSQGF